MDRKALNDFNPIAAYKLRGQRYAFYVGAKLVFLLCVSIIATTTLLASSLADSTFPLLYSISISTLKVAGVVMPFLAFESLYWLVRFRHERSAARSCSTNKKLS